VLTVLNTPDANLNRVQANIKAELDALQAQVPAKKTPYTPITSDYSVRLTDVLVLATPVTDINVTLPAAQTCVGERFTVKNKSTSALVNVRGQHLNGAFQTIDGQAPYVVPSDAAITVHSIGTGWEVV
jgi:hypothetical protein